MSRGLLHLTLIAVLLAAGPRAVLAEPAFEPPETVTIPAGPFVSGSDRAERERAYTLDEAAYGHSVTRRDKWYENELARGERRTGAFAIMRTPVTNADYARFVAETGHRAPTVDKETWDGYRLIHPFERTQKFQWLDGKPFDDEPPAGREGHPVVLVSHADARAYAAWLSDKTGRNWRLPTEIEWEKAMRGIDGRAFPWGDDWDPSRLNSHDAGPFDTLPVGSFPQGASPYGVLDAVGQVFEWVAEGPREDRRYVKGGSWDDRGCGVCRPAERHSRPADIKHILIGFRLVME